MTMTILREARTFLDGVLQRTPGYSTRLPPRRDFFGEPVKAAVGWAPWGTDDPVANVASPSRFSEDVKDRVKVELANLQSGFRPPSSKYKGFDLKGWVNRSGQDAYDRYLQLTGQVQLGGRNMHDAVDRLISSKRYQSLPKPDEANQEDNERVKEIRSIVLDYRQAAMRQLQKEYPQIEQDVQKLERQQRVGLKPARTMDILSSLPK
jgi:hypothetical protein